MPDWREYGLPTDEGLDYGLPTTDYRLLPTRDYRLVN
jgi:hypothetical protein